MVDFANFGGLTSVLDFHIFLVFNCEELVRIRAICEGLVRFFSDVKNWHCEESVPVLHTCEELVLNFHKSEESVSNAHRCEKSNQFFADVKKIKFHQY